MHVRVLGTVVTLQIAIVHATCETYHEIISSGNDQPNFRWYRSVSGFAQPAIKALIHSAREVPTKSVRFKKLVKQGSLSNAIADFQKLMPTNVEDKMYSTFASVGDLRVQFKQRDMRHNHAPTLQIVDPDSHTSFVVVYIKTGSNVP